MTQNQPAAKKTAAKKAPAKKAPAKKAAAPAKKAETHNTDAPPTPGEGDDIVVATVEKPVGAAAQKRADWIRALEEERDQLKVVGKTERVKQVEAEIARAKSAPSARQAPAQVES